MKPFLKWCKYRGISRRKGYYDVGKGDLTLTKVGSRSFVSDEDDAAWFNRQPRVTGTAGNRALQAAAKQVEELGRAVAEGRVDRERVVAQLIDAARRAGLVLELTA